MTKYDPRTVKRRSSKTTASPPGPDAINNLPITPGWNYIVRMYQPKTALLEGSWHFPKAEPVE